VSRRSDELIRAFPPPEGAFDRLILAQEHKARARKAKATAFALLLAAILVISLVATLSARKKPQIPATPHIDITNVSSLGLVWSANVGSPVTGQPTVSGGRIYVASGVPGPRVSGQLTVFPASCAGQDGWCSPVWSAPLFAGGKQGPGYVNWWGSATVSGDRVYAGTSDGYVLGFPTACSASCRPEWKGLTDGSSSESTTVAAKGLILAVSNVAPTAPSSTGFLDAFPENCADPCPPVWRGRWSSPYKNFAAHGASPVVSGGIAYIASLEGVVQAYDLSCGTGGRVCDPSWRLRLPQGLALSDSQSGAGTPLRVDHNTLFVAVGNVISAIPIPCRDVAACPHTVVGRTSNEVDGIVVAGGRIYASSGDGTLWIFPEVCVPRQGKCRPDAVIHGISTGANPYVANGLLFIGSSTGIEAFHAGCGGVAPACTPLWSAPTNTELDSAPTEADGILYAADNSGDVYAFAPHGIALVGPPSASAGSTKSGKGSPGLYAFYALVLVAMAGWVFRRRLFRSRGLRAAPSP
jgi:hypothetical protein